jgi:hypothetical protein
MYLLYPLTYNIVSLLFVIVQFVMNTQAEIYQTFADYQEGKNGFERAPGWRSEIGRPLTDPNYKRR